jgi:arabinosaccharide transport system substrate-binding protein
MMQRVLKFFPYGYAPLLLLVVSIASGAWIFLHPASSKHATIRLWTFTVLHADPYKNIMPEIEARFPGKTVDVQLVHVTAVSSRLRAAFWADLDVPDLVEVEISKSGSFFRGPLDDVGFVDLTQRLRETGYLDRIVPTRLAPYTNRGKIFGLPHDIHPVMLAYRRDLMEELGVDVSKLTTWDEFIAIGRKLTQPGKRYMIMLSDAGAGHLETILFQRDGGYFDRDGKLIMDNDIAVETMKWYVPLVTGPDRVAMDLGSGNVLTQSVEQGYILFYLSPDWYSKYLERETPRMSGKMALMPLPAVKPGARRTSTMGGTMMAITKKCQNQDMAWSILEKLYLDTEFLAERFRQTNILPAIKDAWKHPAFDEKRPYWSGLPIGRMYADLGNDVPPQFSSPYSDAARAKMGKALTSCVAYYSAHGDKGFDEFVRRELKSCADQVRVLMGRDAF